MAQLPSVPCDYPNVEVKEHLSLWLSEQKLARWLYPLPGDMQALVGWWQGVGGGGVGEATESCQMRQGVNVLAGESIPQNARFKWWEYVQTFKGKYSESGDPGQFFFWS